MRLPCGHAAAAPGCVHCRLAARLAPASPGRAAQRSDPPARCASLGERLEWRAGCQSGLGCRHRCDSADPRVPGVVGLPMVCVPQEDCGPACPGYHVRHPGSVTAADLALIPVPPPRSDKCVLTLAHGPRGRELLSVSGPALSAYADRVGADFRVITPPDGHPMWYMGWKFAAGNFLRAYDRVLWVDADALVMPHCQDVFDLVPRTHVALYDDLQDLHLGHGYAWLYAETEQLQRSQGLRLVPLKGYRNSGVWLAGREHAAAWDPPPQPLPVAPGKAAPEHCMEQHWHNMELERLGFPVYDLPASLNCQWWSFGRHDPASFAAAEVMHFAGIAGDHAQRMTLMRAAAATATSPPSLTVGGAGPDGLLPAA